MQEKNTTVNLKQVWCWLKDPELLSAENYKEKSQEKKTQCNSMWNGRSVTIFF